MKNLKICTKCIQPNTRPGIFFSEESICGACLWEEEKKKIDWLKRIGELKQLVTEVKSKNATYDCVIGVSGGKDSTKQALTARDTLGLRCLLVNYQPDNITNIGKKNIENLKQLGFDVISIRPNPKIMKKMIKFDFFNHLNPVKATEFSLYSSSYIIAEKFQIPLIIQGENPGLTVGTSLTGVGKDSDALKAYQLQTLSEGWREYLQIENITEKDLFLFHYDVEKLIERNTKGIWLQYFLEDWSYRGNAEFSSKFGFEGRNDVKPEEIGTYVSFGALDSDLVPVNQMFKFLKFGFGFCMDHVCYDIRDGHMDRKSGIDLVLKYDGKCSEHFVKEFCDFIDITEEEFHTTTEKFRGEMWHEEKGVLINHIQQELQRLRDEL
jgi:N-acetyl sugar amidotransferase